MSTLKHALVRILATDGSSKHPVGGGFLASPQHVMTCAHVVASALNLPHNLQDAPPQAINLDFPLLPKRPDRQAKVIHWEPAQEQSRAQGVEDIAVLELTDVLPTGAKAAPVFEHAEYHGQAVELFGFPSGMEHQGSPISGSLRSLVASGKVHIDSENGRFKVAPGFSGTPVWDVREQAVVGILHSIYRDRQDIPAYMITASALIKAWPDLKRHNRSHLGGRLGELVDRFHAAPKPVRDRIRDFSPYFEEKTIHFTGRDFVFEAFDTFRRQHPRGYFVLRGDPGIGKTSLTCELVKKRGYLHHFNIRSEGINRTSTFLTNICAQLIAAFRLEHTELPPETTDNSTIISQLLREATEKDVQKDGVVLVVDALDEVDDLDSSGTNILFLPSVLPEGVYVFVTTRRDHKIPLRMNCEHQFFDLKQDSQDNISDIHSYVARSAEGPLIQAYLHRQSLDKSGFVRLLTDRSQGNFMYLRYVIPEIERGSYKDTALQAIPAGLQNYYEDHWRRMKGKDEDSWFKYKLPVIVALTIVREPISIALIADFSKVKEYARINSVLKEWDQFIHKQTIPYQGKLQERCRIYHASFLDFLAEKEEVAGERVDLRGAHGVIADVLWDELFSD